MSATNGQAAQAQAGKRKRPSKYLSIFGMQDTWRGSDKDIAWKQTAKAHFDRTMMDAAASSIVGHKSHDHHPSITTTSFPSTVIDYISFLHTSCAIPKLKSNLLLSSGINTSTIPPISVLSNRSFRHTPSKIFRQHG